MSVKLSESDKQIYKILNKRGITVAKKDLQKIKKKKELLSLLQDYATDPMTLLPIPNQNAFFFFRISDRTKKETLLREINSVPLSNQEKNDLKKFVRNIRHDFTIDIKYSGLVLNSADAIVDFQSALRVRYDQFLSNRKLLIKNIQKRNGLSLVSILSKREVDSIREKADIVNNFSLSFIFRSNTKEIDEFISYFKDLINLRIGMVRKRDGIILNTRKIKWFTNWKRL